MGCRSGGRDWPLGSGRCRLGNASQPGEHRRPRGTGGTHPGRSSCVWNVVTPSGSGLLPGKPTVREAQSPGGNRMTEKRMPVAERQRETRSVDGWPLRWLLLDNRPDTGTRCPDPKGC